MGTELIDEVTRLCDRTKHELLAVILAQQTEVLEPVQSLEPDKLWSIEEAARYLQVDVKTIRNRLDKTDDPNPLPVRCVGVQIRFKKDELDEWTLREAAERASKKADTEERRRGLKAVEGS